MKHLKQFLLAVLMMLMSSVTAYAHDFEAENEGSTIYYKINYNEVLTCAVSYRGFSDNEYSNEYSGNVVIPSEVSYNGRTYKGNSIEWGAFKDCSGLNSVTIGSSQIPGAFSLF